jgi:glycosyltransferase involved in cell wall biosynthesis
VTRVALVVPTMEGGGAEKVVFMLASEFLKRGVSVDLVVGRAEGVFIERLPKGVEIFELGRSRMTHNWWRLARYLWVRKPRVVLSHMTHTNLVTVAAYLIGGWRSKIFLVEHTPLDQFLKHINNAAQRKLTLMAINCFYRLARGVIAVSEGVKEELCRQAPRLNGCVGRIYNPIVEQPRNINNEIRAGHAWVDMGKPFVLAIGRLSKEKNFEFLIDTLAPLLREMELKLIILGEGSEREILEARIASQNVAEFVSMPGFVQNVGNYLKKAKVLALCSLYEGLPTVIVEALACGTQVVATRCHTGPEEILESGRYGHLVLEGDEKGFRSAIVQAITNPKPRQLLISRSKDFSVSRAIDQYLIMIGLPEFCSDKDETPVPWKSTPDW